MHRNFSRSIWALVVAAPLAHGAAPAAPPAAPKGVMLMNRIGPTSAELYLANADGSGERKLLQNSAFDYNAAYSLDGKWVAFTSERTAQGQADVYRARADGSGIERLTDMTSVDDQGALSPDGTRLAFVSTRGSEQRANIWIQELRGGRARNLTAAASAAAEALLPNGYFRPAWSPDGQWLAFSSDRNTPWRGHSNSEAWEHTQSLGVYVIRADGTGLRQIAFTPERTMGSPKWSPDGKRVVFYEMSVEDTFGAHRPDRVAALISQIVSVDVATGQRTEHTSGPGLKLHPQFLNAKDLAYLVKGGPNEGLHYTSGTAPVKRAVRAPVWSPDGKQVIYEKVAFRPVFAQFRPLQSWDAEWDYRHMDVFPTLSPGGRLLFTEKAVDSSLIVMNPDGSGRRQVYDANTSGLDRGLIARGLAGAFQPAWSRDGAWIAFGLGEWFFQRSTRSAKIMRIRSDGTGLEQLTDGTVHSGFPSYSADGKQIVFRVWGGKEQRGLRILDLEDRSVRVLTDQWDNLPGWSPDGSRILFTRKVDSVNYDIFTIKPDGTDLRQVTTHPSGDGHAVWNADGRILWSASSQGFRDESALYDNTFQPYGQIWIMNADGTGKRMLTDSRWEDSMPVYLPRATQ